jgi:hypothetical protein
MTACAKFIVFLVVFATWIARQSDRRSKFPLFLPTIARRLIVTPEPRRQLSMKQAERIASAINKAISEELAGEPISFQELSVATIGVVSAYADAALVSGVKQDFSLYVLHGLSEHIAALADPNGGLIPSSSEPRRRQGGSMQ